MVLLATLPWVALSTLVSSRHVQLPLKCGLSRRTWQLIQVLCATIADDLISTAYGLQSLYMHKQSAVVSSYKLTQAQNVLLHHGFLKKLCGFLSVFHSFKYPFLLPVQSATRWCTVGLHLILLLVKVAVTSRLSNACIGE